ncbi:hypothetical protein [Arthrobacter sp. JCM 19049]|uniref:hypothetical protein n=1 Tax=Arthrobacter sp. JCM 19049 TaxID=1460643 RepID=UPI000A861E06|nr:hypothetical protein [Arthrobacter sp. JCM 19049]
MRRYEPNRRPYVEVREGDHRFHAQVIGWNQGDVFIEYPTRILNRVTTGQREVKWVPTAAAIRIRRADSIWRVPRTITPGTPSRTSGSRTGQTRGPSTPKSCPNKTRPRISIRASGSSLRG